MINMNSRVNAIKINEKTISPGNSAYIIAEMSANHGGNFQRAVDIIYAAKECGADAVKIQTYTADTLTLRSDKPQFQINHGPWKGQTMYELYCKAHTPWEWQPKLMDIANKADITLFSTPFDATSVDFLEEINVPAYKIASYELIELPLIEKVASTGKPLILSTGNATLSEIDEAVRTAESAGAKEIALLKCVTSYPAPPEAMNLRTIPHMQEAFNLPTGLSDHSLGIAVSVAAVSLGACIIEKHFTLDRTIETADSFFSMEPHEFKEMVQSVRIAEKALGEVHYALYKDVGRRSLISISDIKRGEPFAYNNVRSLRPGGGLSPSFWSLVEGRKTCLSIPKGTHLTWNMVGEAKEA